MTDTEVLDARTSPAVAHLAARATLAHATVGLAVEWIDGLRHDETVERDRDGTAYMVPSIEAFCRAWLAMTKSENPENVIEVALDGFIENVGWLGDLATMARTMLMEAAIQPIIAGLRSDLLFADRRLNTLQTYLDALQATDAADGGTSGPTTLAALTAVETALQQAADLGVTGPALQRVLDVWANMTGGPRVTLHSMPAG